MLLKPIRTILAAAALAVALTPVALTPVARAADVTVFAAASTTNALTEIGAAFTAATGHKLVPSFAASSTLAKQVEEGAPAQVFISANAQWADYLDKKGLLVAGSRADLLGNSLVLIAPQASTAAPKIEKGFPLADLLGDGRLSVGDPEHVPVGIYTKEALTNLGVWDAVASKLAPANDVRAALALVERGEAPLGIVYSTDAAVAKDVKIVAVFPADSHKPIAYPVALIKGASQEAADFLAFLKTDTAKAIFAKYGFSVN